MAKDQKKIHASRGIYLGGDWVPIEDLGDMLQNSSKKQRCNQCRSRSANTSRKPDGSYDVVIIGAGAVGSTIARELSKTTASVLLLEGADDVTQGATKGNSGIVHAGYDDKPGSVRAKFCWPGNQMFPQLDRELHFGYEKSGSLVVAKGKEEEAILEDLYQRGQKNGVKNLRIIGLEELKEKEPYIHPDATAALYSPDAGTITPYEFTIAVAENAVDNGVELRIRRVVTGIDKDEDGSFLITAKHWEPKKKFLRHANSMRRNMAFILIGALLPIHPVLHELVGFQQSIVISAIVCAIAGFTYYTYATGANEGGLADGGEVDYEPSKGTHQGGASVVEQIRAQYVVNAAGCGSDKIAQMVGDDSFKIKPRMGEYILLHKDEGYKAKHILFPTPHPFLGKGVLVQQTLWGNLILGPTARDTLKKNPDTGEYEVDPEVRDQSADSIMSFILSKCKNLIPSLDAGKVIHAFAGARAKNTRGDWIVEACAKEPKMIHAAGIDSPGIAGSPAVAVEVVRLLEAAGAPVREMNPKFNPYRAPIVTPKQGWKGIKAGPVGKWKDPKVNVVCKCELVTEEEVIEACRRSLPIDSTQAIRKRTRAGMGHCQGDPENYGCEDRVAAIIARELNMKLEDVGRRPWPASSLLPQRFITDEEKEHIHSLSFAS